MTKTGIITFCLGFAIGSLVAAYGADRYHIHVINIESGMPSDYVTEQVKQGLKLVRKAKKDRFKLASYEEAIDFSPKHLTRDERADFFELLYRPRRRHISIGLYDAQHKSAFGIARLCDRRPFVGIGIKPDIPGDFIKFAVAHEIGHVLGSDHREPLLFGDDSDPVMTIMYPYWDSFLKGISSGRSTWRYKRKTKKEWQQCGIYTQPTEWIE